MALPHQLTITGSGFDAGEFFYGCNADITDGPPGSGSRGLAPGEDALSVNFNRAAYALAENDEYLHGKITRDIGTPEVAALTGHSGTTIVIDPSNTSGDVLYDGTLYLGEATWPGAGFTTQERLDQLFQLLDENYNEVLVGGSEVKVTSLAGNSLGDGFVSTATTLGLNATLPSGNYRIAYLAGTTLEDLPPYAFSLAGLRGLEELPGEDRPADRVTYAGGPAWHDGTTNPATDVEAQLDKIVTDLVADAGSDRVGSAAKTTGELTWTAGSAKDHMLVLAGEVEKLRIASREASLQRSLNVVDGVVDVFGGITGAQIVASAAVPSSNYRNTSFFYLLGQNDSTGVGYIVRLQYLPNDVWATPVTGSITGSAWGETNDIHYGFNYTIDDDYLVAVGRITASGGAAVAYSAVPNTNLTGGTVTGHTGAGDSARAVIWDHINEYWVIGGTDGTNGWIARQASIPTGTWSAPTTFPGSTTVINGLGYDGNGTLMATTRIPTNGVILKSTDGGDTWSTVLSNSGAFEFYGVHYNILLGMWFAMDAFGYVWRSDDGGTSWVKGANHVDSSSLVLAVDDSGVLYSVYGSFVGYSVDLGDTWHLSQFDTTTAAYSEPSFYRLHKTAAYRNGHMIYGGYSALSGKEYYLVSKQGRSHNLPAVTENPQPEFFIQ